ncbi:zinc finger, CCHC-type containing protein [Tanacetum coccineum]
MVAATMKHMASNFAKLDKFEGVDFRRWQKKMHILLSSISVVYVLTTHIPEDGGDDATMKQSRKRAKWDNDDYICRGLILNDFKHTLKHNKEELTLVELSSHLCIKESLRMQDSYKPKGNNVAGLSVVNMMEHNNSSRFCYVYLLHTKDEALDKFNVFKTEVELQQGSLIKRFRTDRGGEYMDTLYFHSVGIIHETTAPYTPQQNGISERKIRVLKEMVNSMLSYSGLSQGFWGEVKEALNASLLNMLSIPRVFRFYVIEPNESVSINSIIESKDAIFDENIFSSFPRPSHRPLINETKDIGGSVVSQEDDPETFDEAMKSQDVAF